MVRLPSLVVTTAPSLHLVPVPWSVAPTPAQFWAVVVWGVLPAVAGIWIAYRQQQARLRQLHRRLRQLEARLDRTESPQAPLPVRMPPAVSRNPRPSPLTTCILLPGTSPKGPPYTQPVPRAVS